MDDRASARGVWPADRTDARRFSPPRKRHAEAVRWSGSSGRRRERSKIRPTPSSSACGADHRPYGLRNSRQIAGKTFAG